MEYPKRKHPRLKEYDYRLPGYYYVTIHTEKGAPALSGIQAVDQLGTVRVILSEHGKIAQQQLHALETRYANVKIDKYVIMPTHIHAIIQLTETAAMGPALTEVVAAFKSLTTRRCNSRFHTPGRKLFQASFYEKVLRNERMYQECWQYIDGNPGKWLIEPEDI